MGGRGRGGRGRGMSFNVESLGFGRGEALPPPILQPPPIFPPLEWKPSSLQNGDEWNYMLALRKQFRNSMLESPYNLKTQTAKRDVDRYSDKYKQDTHRLSKQEEWKPDWSRLPSELKIKTVKKTKVLKPSIPKRRGKGDVDITKTLEELEKKEQQGTDDSDQSDKEVEKKSDEEDVEEELEEEVEEDEGADYIQSYFDNGENYLDEEEDALDDGPVY